MMLTFLLWQRVSHLEAFRSVCDQRMQLQLLLCMSCVDHVGGAFQGLLLHRVAPYQLTEGHTQECELMCVVLHSLW